MVRSRTSPRTARTAVASAAVGMAVLMGPVHAAAGPLARQEAPTIPTLDGVDRAVSDQVVRLYLTVLGRMPDPAGFAANVGALQGGMSVEALAGLMLGSEEYAGRYGTPDDTAFVTTLYDNALAREPEEGALEQWLAGIANGLSRAAVATGFAQSAEAIAVTGTLAPPPPPPAPPAPETPPAPAPGAPTDLPATRLGRGARGEDVRRVQAFLEQYGYAPGPVDGIYGSRTAGAVARFQTEARGAGWYPYSVDGIWGPKTQAAALQKLGGAPPAAPPPAAPAPASGFALMSRGARGPAVQKLQQRLLDLGFWHLGVDGDFGYTTQQAVMAFQKYYELPRTARVDERTSFALGLPLPPAQARTTSGSVVEVDKRRQVVMIVRNGRTVLTLNASTGSGKRYVTVGKNTGIVYDSIARTPEGRFRVYRQHADGWRDGDLGRLYRPKYFYGGVALHGSNSVPSYPASHGCVRVNNPAMDLIWAQNLVPMGSAVWVYS